MLLSLLALSILFIPFTLIEAAWMPPVLDTHVQYGLNLTFAWWLKSGTVRYIQAAFGSPEEAASTAHTRQIWPKEAEILWGGLQAAWACMGPYRHSVHRKFIVILSYFKIEWKLALSDMLNIFKKDSDSFSFLFAKVWGPPINLISDWVYSFISKTLQSSVFKCSQSKGKRKSVSIYYSYYGQT